MLQNFFVLEVVSENDVLCTTIEFNIQWVVVTSIVAAYAQEITRGEQ